MRKATMNNNSIAQKARAIGVGMALVVTSVVGALIASAVCISNEYLSLTVFEKIIPILHYISALVGVLAISYVPMDDKTRTIMILCGLIAILELCISLVFFNGITWRFWINIIAIMAAMLTGIILARQKKFRLRTRKRKSVRR